MSLTSPIPDENGIAHSAVGLGCFYCYRPLEDPAIYWAGSSGEIYLHPPCVLALGIRLARDCHEVDAPELYRRLRERRSHDDTP